MKILGRLAVLGAAIAVSSSLAFADSYSLGSFATGTTASSLGNNSTQTSMSYLGFVAQNFGTSYVTPPTTAPSNGAPASTFALNPAGVWAPAQPNSTWVGYAATAGPGGVNPAQGFYTFQTTFMDTTGSTGMLNVLADDTVEVYLNGTLIVPFGTVGSDVHCADGTPNCSTLYSTGINTLSGQNTLTFVVVQEGNENAGDPTGVDFNATLSSSQTPEPSSLVLLGTGLMGAAGTMFRRRFAA